MSSQNPMSIPGGWKKDKDSSGDSTHTQTQDKKLDPASIPRSATGLVSDSGEIIDHEGRTIGKVTESEDGRSLVGNTVNEAGDIVNEAGDKLAHVTLDDSEPEKEYSTEKKEKKEEDQTPKAQDDDKKSGTGNGFFSSASSLAKNSVASFSRSKKEPDSEGGQQATSDDADDQKADTEVQTAKPDAVSKTQDDLKEVEPKPEDDSKSKAESKRGDDLESLTDAGDALKSGQSDEGPDLGTPGPEDSVSQVSGDKKPAESLKSNNFGDDAVAPSQIPDAQSKADSKADDVQSKADDTKSKAADDVQSKADDAQSKAADDVQSKADDAQSKADDAQSKAAPSNTGEDDDDNKTQSLKSNNFGSEAIAPSQIPDASSQAPGGDDDDNKTQSLKSNNFGSEAIAPSQIPDPSDAGSKAGESQASGQSEATAKPESQAAGASSEAPEGEAQKEDAKSEAPKSEAGESRAEGSQGGPVALEDREQEDDQKTVGGKTDADQSQKADEAAGEATGEATEAAEAAEAEVPKGEEQAQQEVEGQKDEAKEQVEETKEEAKEDVQEEEEGEKLDFTILKGGKVNKVGNVVDSKGELVGKVIEGNVKQLLGKKCDEEGNIWNDAGKIVGKAQPISQADRDDQKDFAPFENFPDAIVESDGRVTSKGEQVGIVVEGDPKRLKGSKVDEDGDILDRNGNVVGKAEPGEKEEPVEEEPEKVDTSSLKNGKVNKVGNIVDSKGDVIGRVIEGNVKQLVGKTCDENGDIWDSSGKVIGKGQPLSSGDRDEQKSYAPFENFPDAVVEGDGSVTSEGKRVGTVVQGDAKRLKGSKVDEDGDILDRNGNVVGKAEPWDEPEAEAEQVVDRSALAGKRVNKKGNVVDSSGTIYGRLIEGNLSNLVGRMCDKEGNVRSESGDIIGKAEIVSEGEREGSKDGPFAELSGLTVGKDGKVVTPSGDVVGRLVSGDASALTGRSVDEDGDVTDKNGNVLGKAERWTEPEVEKKKDPLSGRKVNREGNVVDEDGNLIGKLTSGDLQICAGKEIDDDGDVVDSKGNTIGHVSLLENIPEPEPEPEHVETEEERKAREAEEKKQADEAKVQEENEKDRKLAGQLGGCIEQALDKVKPICNMISSKIDEAERKPKEELDEEALVREVRPLIEEGGKILSEANGMIRGLDPDGRIQRQSKARSGTKEASPEEHHLAEQLKELTGTVSQTIDNAKRKIEGMPHAKKELNPLWGLLMEPLGQILAAVGLLLTGVLGLVGKLLSGLGLGGLVDGLLGGLGLNKILGSLGLGQAYDALVGKKKK